MQNLYIALAFGAGFLVIFAVNLLFTDAFEVRRKRIRKRLEEECLLLQRERARGSMQHKELYELAAEGFATPDTKMTAHGLCTSGLPVNS